MSDISTTNTPRRTRETRPNIELPDGEILEPRLNFADELGICDKSAQRRISRRPTLAASPMWRVMPA